MNKNRLEAFSDGVIAIIITIMVLEMKVPHGTHLADLLPLLPVFLSYVLSFIYVGIYWNNHHHMLHTVKRIDGRVLWANLHLLFWLSLFPFVTGWMGENHFEILPIVLYGGVLLMASIAFKLLQSLLVAADFPDSRLAGALGSDRKGILSTVGYLIGIGLAFVAPWMAITVFVLIACIWFVPDQRFEKAAAR